MDYRTGGAVVSSPTGVIATKIGNEISTRPVVATLQGGGGGGGGGCNGGNSPTNVAYSQGSGGNTPTYRVVWKNGCAEDSATLPANPSRKAWRQLIQQ
jgi:hypothetical protein